MFGAYCLHELDEFLGGYQVEPMRVLAERLREGVVKDAVTYMRHDIDDDLYKSLEFARWEHDRGYRATYFALPTAPYWTKTAVTQDALLTIQALGHEIGLHCDVYHYMPDPDYAIARLAEEAETLRSWGLKVVGCADHGSGEPYNVDLWDPDVHGRQPSEAGFLYEAYLTQRAANVTYISDNGGRWRAPLLRKPDQPTVVLIHPQHWVIP